MKFGKNLCIFFTNYYSLQGKLLLIAFSSYDWLLSRLNFFKEKYLLPVSLKHNSLPVKNFNNFEEHFPLSLSFLHLYRFV